MKRLSKEDLHLSESELVALALTKIEMSVSRSEQSSAGLTKKLKLAGFRDSVINEAIRQAKKKGFVDDLRYLNCFARKCLREKRGIGILEKEAWKLNIDLSDVEESLQIVNKGECGQIEMARAYLNLHKQTKSKDKFSAYKGRLLRRGFSNNVATKVAAEFCDSIHLTF